MSGLTRPINRWSSWLSEAMSPQVLMGSQPTEVSQLRADIAALRDELSSFRQARMAAAQEETNRRSIMTQHWAAVRANMATRPGRRTELSTNIPGWMGARGATNVSDGPKNAIPGQ